MNDRRSESDSDDLSAVRHALAHALARAVCELCPGTQLGAAQVTADGFCHDFVLPPERGALHPEDLPELERRMRAILEPPPDEVALLPAPDVLSALEAAGQPFQRELAERSLERDASSPAMLVLLRSASVTQWCVDAKAHAQARPARDGFELRSLAGAYFRGDARNVMMTRVYGWAMASREELEAKRAEFEHAALREHKKLGRELELFAFDDEIGPGLPLWLPNGTAIRDELERLMRELEFDAGFERVATPHVARQELYYRTGHLPYYAEGMFPFMQHPNDPLRPMNCPHHHRVFAAKRRSHRACSRGRKSLGAS